MADPTFPDKRAVRRSFDRAAATYDAHGVLQREVNQRLLSHLELIKLAPARVLDLGCGTGASLPALRKSFPEAQVIALDIAPGMLAQARARTPWLQRMIGSRTPQLVCGDAERLPFASASLQFVFSNLALQWCRPELALAECARVLAPGGLMMFSTFGPDTLKELRQAFAAVDGYEHVNRFVDMHDIGDTLVGFGLADPVMEMEVITLEYDTVDAVMADLKAIGARNALPGRPRGLTGKSRWGMVAAQYEKYRLNGALPASFEVVYGHAWKVQPKRTSDGRQVIDFPPRTLR